MHNANWRKMFTVSNQMSGFCSSILIASGAPSEYQIRGVNPSTEELRKIVRVCVVPEIHPNALWR